MTNPLLELADLPAFGRIRPEHVEPAIDRVLAENREQIARLTAAADGHDWQSLVESTESMQHRLERVWSPVSHLNAVMNNDALREAYNTCLAKLTEYGTEVGQNDRLYQAFEQLNEHHRDEFDDAQKKLIDNTLRDFRLSGVHLPPEEREQVASLTLELSALQSRFEENLLDATNAWSCLVTDAREVAGIPEQALKRAAAEAEQRGHKGCWHFGLDFPSYYAVIAHADDRALRKRFHDAWVTRASDLAEGDASQWDNGPLMKRILSLRDQLAKLVGFEHYAAYSLATKMAADSDEVIGFLRDLAARSRPVAESEFAELEKFAGRTLEPWDVAYYAEKMQKHLFDVSEEELRPYFPVDRAMSGLFEVTEQLYRVRIEEQSVEDAWHADVSLYAVRDEGGELLGQFYVDLYARENKRGGAWMDECIGRRRVGRELRTPVAYLVCNFMPPGEGTPGLLTHSEIVTLFHEFGHTLHLLLTRVDYPSISGINGVPWDAVELPSQFMENFVWTDDVLPRVSGHYKSGAPLPDEVFDKLLGTRTFQAGMAMVRQLEFALFDMRLHSEYSDDIDILEIIAQVRAEVSVVPVGDNNRFANGFSHIFAGGYAAGYYSYKWAEVLSADAFSAFEGGDDILDAGTGLRFRRAVLEAGGSVDALQAFVNFRGRKPKLDALLRHSGIEDAA